MTTISGTNATHANHQWLWVGKANASKTPDKTGAMRETAISIVLALNLLFLP
jgi:hypothetical protein